MFPIFSDCWLALGTAPAVKILPVLLLYCSDENAWGGYTSKYLAEEFGA